jgi:hypothetical protein
VVLINFRPSAAARQIYKNRSLWHYYCSNAFGKNSGESTGGKIFMSEENNTGNNLIWAITTLIIVAIIAGALYYSGFLSGNNTKKEKIDINISAPAR